MGHDELCNVSRYADKQYTKQAPLPTAFPPRRGTAHTDADITEGPMQPQITFPLAAWERHEQEAHEAQLTAMKAALLSPLYPRHDTLATTHRRQKQQQQQQQQHEPQPQDDTDVILSHDTNHRRHPESLHTEEANENKPCRHLASLQDDIAIPSVDGPGVADDAISTAAAADTPSTAAADVLNIYSKVEEVGGSHAVAAKQALVREFLLDGSAQLNGQTLSGYPIYGHRTAEERLEALRSALYDANQDPEHRSTVRHVEDLVGTEWKAVHQPPSRLIFPADEHTTLPANAVENEVVVPESREQYWRRLAHHYIAQHAAETGEDKPGEPEDPFYIIDLGRVVEQMALWRHCLPMVRPHFAVKCNPNPAIIEVLAACGAGFDCASKAEIDLILQGGKKGPGSLVESSDDIIFANPCKQPGDLKAAAACGVNYVTFDSVRELQKIATYMPNAKAILRIKTNDAKAVCQFSVKFGAPLEDVEELLDAARRLNVEIYGVSFHVGSGNGDASAYTSAVRDAHKVFQMASRKGFNCTILDIGGGYPGVTPTAEERLLSGGVSFEEIASELRPVLEELFPSEDTTIIAEPGRYFTAATHALVMNVFASRTLRLSDHERELCRRDLRELAKLKKAVRQQQQQHVQPEDTADEEDETACFGLDLEEEVEHQYYVNDGLYGSFNCIIFDHASPTLLLLHDDDGADANVREAPTTTATTAMATTMTTTTTTTVVSQTYGAISPVSPQPGRSAVFSTGASAADGVHVCVDEDAVQRGVLARRRQQPPRPLRLTTIYGPTCDSMDCILKKKLFPEMRVGDWLLAPDMGSYTTAAGCAFNGFLTRRREWVCSVDI